jgi:predicted RND superfamily exporter protein
VPPSLRPHHLAFGIERFGFVALRFPILISILLAALSIGAAFGVGRIKVDDSLSHLFRSDTPEFRQYEEVTNRFPSSEFDVLLVVEGKKLLERDSLEKLRDTVTDLQLVNGTRGLISLFSARQAPEGGKLPAPLFPEELPTGAQYDQLIAQVKTNEIIRGKMLSDDGQLALVVLALEPSVVRSNALKDVIHDIQKTVDEDLGGSGVSARLAGVPVMQLEIRNAVERDRLIYNGFGFAAGCLIAIVFFRRLSFMVVAAGPPLIAILLALGTLGWLGFSLNMFLNVMTPLIMVISFSDSMQLTFEARDRLLKGESKKEAFRNAILVVGPACVLTHATAAVSFVALQFSQSDLIRSFGQAGLIATLIALAAVLVLVPLLGLVLVRNVSGLAEKAAVADRAVNVLRDFCTWIARKMVARSGLYSLIALVVVAALGAIYFQLDPRYRLADQVPDRQQAVQASSRIDAKLTGANPIDVLIRFPKGAELYAPETLDAINAVQSVLEKQAGVGNVWSLATLQRWLAEKTGHADVATLKKYVDLLPDTIKRTNSRHRRKPVAAHRSPDRRCAQCRAREPPRL